MFSNSVGRPPSTRTINIHPGWLLIPAGLAACLLIGLALGYFQSVMLAALMLGAGLALVWVLVVAVRPEWALLFYALFAVNLNGVDLPVSFGGVRISPDIVLTVLLIAGTALRLLHHRQPLSKLKITAPYLIFLAVPFVTLIWSPVPVQSVKGVFRFVGYYALMWLIVDTIRTRQQVLRLVSAIMLSPLVPVAVGFVQLATGGGQTIWAGAVYNRVYGLAGGPFTLAYYLVLVIPLLFIFFLAGGERTERPNPVSDEKPGLPVNRLLLGVLLAGSLVTLVLTFIRGAWIALLLTILLLAVLRGTLRFRQLLITLPAAVAATVAIYSPVLDRIAQTADPTSTFFGRLEIWKFATEWIAANPLNFLAGVGMKAFEYYYILLSGPLSGGLSGLFWRREQFLLGNRPHNELIGFMLDVGLIGTVALIAVLVIVVRTALRIFRQAPDELLKLIALAFLVASAGMLVGAMGDNVFSQPTVAVYFWLLAGIILAIDQSLMDADGAGDVVAAVPD